MIVPNLNPHTRTYQIVAPVSTHFRRATCAEVECAGWRNGWKTIVATNSEQAQYIESGASGRVYSARPAGPGIVEYVFPAGQTCFSASTHRVPLERDPIFRVRDGRGSPTTHRRPEHWTEDFADHLDRVRKIREG